MNTKRFLRKGWVWLILILAFLLIAGSILTSNYFNPWLQEKLEIRVAEETKGLYRLHLHGLNASLLSGSIRADSLHLEPDFDAWERNQQAGQQDSTGQRSAPSTLADFQASNLQVSGINFIGLLRGKPLDINRLRARQPELVINQMRQDTSSQQEPLHESLKGIAKGLKIKHIDFGEGKLRIRDRKDSDSDRISLKDLSIEVDDLQLDSGSFHDQTRAYYARRIALETGKARFREPGGVYLLQAAALKANTADGTLNIGNFKLIPLLKNAAQARRQGEAATTLKLDVPELNASGVDFGLHSRRSNFAVKSIVVKTPSLSAFQDRKNFPQKSVKPLPHDLVQNLKTGLHLHRVEVQGMYIQYEELAPNAVETGKIVFQDLHATITNVTNDKRRMGMKTPAVLEAKASINGEAPLAVTVKLNLLDPDAFHTVRGSAGPADPATLNSILEPTTFLSVKEGRLQRSDFYMELTRHQASGNFNVRYNDFKIDLLTSDEGTHQSFGKKVLSKVANKFVVNSDNPDGDEELRPGKINVVRARTRSVFNYWKDCLVSGFRTAAGVDGLGDSLDDPDR